MQKLIKSLFGYINRDLAFQRPPKMFLKQDSENAKNSLGKTAYYDPRNMKVVVYTSGRHCKDVLRSIAHELVHHHQNERGDFDDCEPMGSGYAQENEHLRNMEKEAYLKGNMLFRDWEDSCKKQMQMEDNNKMKLSELKKIIKKTIKNVIEEKIDEGRKNPHWDPHNAGMHVPNEDRERVAAENERQYKIDMEKKRKGLKEEVEQQIDEAGCDSHGKREDKKSKKEKEKTDEGKAHAKCAKGCYCEPIKEGEEPEVDSATIEEIEEPLMKKIRYLDKLIDELAKGKAMEKILRY